MTAELAKISQLQERSRQLRARSRVLDPVVAESYLRRAAELDAHAALLDAAWNPPSHARGLPAGPRPSDPVPDDPRLALA